MGNYIEEKEFISNIVTNMISEKVEMVSSKEKVVHYAELEFKKSSGFSMDECFDVRYELENAFEGKNVEVDLDEFGNIKVVVEIETCLLGGDEKQISKH